MKSALELEGQSLSMALSAPAPPTWPSALPPWPTTRSGCRATAATLNSTSTGRATITPRPSPFHLMAPPARSIRARTTSDASSPRRRAHLHDRALSSTLAAQIIPIGFGSDSQASDKPAPPIGGSRTLARASDRDASLPFLDSVSDLPITSAVAAVSAAR